MDPSPPLAAAAQLAVIIDWLLKLIAARARVLPWTEPMMRYLGDRLRRIGRDVQAVAALIAAGKIPLERTRKPRDSGEPDAPPPDPAGRKKPSPGMAWAFGMRRFGWLACWIPPLPAACGVGVATAALNALLQTPEMTALLAATPRTRRLLRPLCWMLAAETRLLPPAPPRHSRRRRQKAAPPPEWRDDSPDAVWLPAEGDLPRRRVRLQFGPPGSLTMPFGDHTQSGRKRRRRPPRRKDSALPARA